MQPTSPTHAPPLPWTRLDDVIEAVTARATNLGSSIHGPVHWHSVALASLYLLEAGEPADRPLVFLFALIHDAMRRDDGYDLGHGPRAAALLGELCERRVLVMDVPRAACLDAALRDHASGRTSAEPTIGVCWDADRLDLGRVGIAPDATFFSTTAAQRLVASGQQLRWAETLPDWAALAERFVS